MNKYLKILIYLIIGILQLTLMPILQINGMIPNLILMGIVTLAIVDMYDDAFYLAMVGGLVLDLAGPIFFGFHTIVFVGFVLIIKYLLQKVFPEINIPLIFVITFLFAALFSFLENLFLNRWPSYDLITYSTYSAFLSVIFFLILQKMHGRNQVVKL